jgi:hypothetical protein
MTTFISLDQAVAMTTLYRKEMNEILAEPFQNQNILPICETFEKEDILKILNKKDCEKLRIYYGMDNTSKIHAIVVGVNAQNEDLLPTADNEESTEDDILENAVRCPTACPPSSPLNS